MIINKISISSKCYNFYNQKMLLLTKMAYSSILILQVSNIARPSAYESAIRSKERAREDIQVLTSQFSLKIAGVFPG